MPGVLGNKVSVINESFESDGLEHPHYTIPQTYRQLKVPDVLLSGHHQHIEQWRSKLALETTLKHRPDLVTPQMVDSIGHSIDLK